MPTENISPSLQKHLSEENFLAFAMTTKEEVQALLRFLSQDAKVPLPIAMNKVKELQKFELTR